MRTPLRIHRRCRTTLLAAAGIGAILVGVWDAAAQPPPPPPPPTGPQATGCVGPDGKPLLRLVDLHLVASAVDPFSIDLTWSGPQAEYRVTGPGLMSQFIAPNPTLDTLDPGNLRTGPGRSPGGGLLSPGTQPVSGNVSFRFARPQYPVLPDFVYGFKVEATLPNGTLVCATANARTPPAPIAPLASSFVALDDIRLGFTLPPYVQDLTVERKNYTEDGRYVPSVKRLLQEAVPTSPTPTTFALVDAPRRSFDNRKRVNPGLPPVPKDYGRPPVYDLTVKAVWRDGPRESTTEVVIRVDGLPPLVGWADLHTHPMSDLAFGAKLFHGAPDAGSLLPALSIPTSVIPTAGGIPPPFRCNTLTVLNLADPRSASLRAANIGQALQDDSPTQGDPVQSDCGDFARKALILAIEAAADAHMPQPGRRTGAPVFDAWPAWSDVTHQKMWIDWIARAYDGGLRVLVGLSHNNRLLAELAKGRCDDPARPCLIPTNDAESSDLQIMEMKDFVARHSDLMEVALTPADLYRIVRGDPSRGVRPRIAVVLGVEIDNLGNFRSQSPPTPEQIRSEINRLYSQGVRYIFPVHVSDNVFGGTAPYNPIFDVANAFETGHFWNVECAGTPPYPDDDIGFSTPNLKAVQDFINAIPDPFHLMPTGVALPTAPPNCPGPGHRNTRGLNLSEFANRTSPLIASNPHIGIGVFAIKEMMRLGMIIDVDHMSHRTVEDVLGIAEDVPGGYPLMSGHSAIRSRGGVFNAENARTPAQLDRIGCLGGMFGLGTDHAEPREWAANYQAALTMIQQRGGRCPNKEIGSGAVALGTDTNSLVGSPKPLLEGALTDRNLNVYAAVVTNERGTFTRFPESAISVSSTKTWDYQKDGVVHYGMFADFVKAVWSLPIDRNRKMLMSGQDLVEGHLERNADNFWRMWVKVEQQKKVVR